MAKIKNPWGDGRDADVSDIHCAGRPCLHIGENKGSFVQGRGYTSYYKHPQLECLERHLRGCPHPKPNPDPEIVRCCQAPDFPKPRKGCSKQRCRTCGVWASGWVLEARRTLPHHDHVKCRHHRVKKEPRLETWYCPECKGYWLRKPGLFEKGRTFKEVLDEKFPLIC